MQSEGSLIPTLVREVVEQLRMHFEFVGDSSGTLRDTQIAADEGLVAEYAHLLDENACGVEEGTGNDMNEAATAGTKHHVEL
jgi:hypothetical protein